MFKQRFSTPRFVVASAIVAVLAGCSSSDDPPVDVAEAGVAATTGEAATTGDDAATAGNAADDDTATAGDAGSVAGLDGYWESACFVEEELGEWEFGLFASSIEGVKISGDSIAFSLIGFSDEACTTKNTEQTLEATYTSPGTTELVTGNVATQLDITFNSFNSTAYEEDVIASSNEATLCGRSDWQAGVSYDVSDCDAFAEEGDFPTTYYDIAAVIDDILYMGDYSGEEDGVSPETRPTALDTVNLFNRVGN
ncbi:MAG: hypothetical protein V3U76_20705 [Granulosicoccus sp.]